MPIQKYPAEYFATSECRKKHLGGGIIAWHRLEGRQFLGYREGVRVSSWYAKIEWGKNRSVSLRFGEPDDDYPCDGSVVFSFEQAIEVARSICKEMAISPTAFKAPQGKYRRLPELPPRSPYKVVHAVMDYVDWQRAKGRATQADESVIRTSNRVNTQRLVRMRLRPPPFSSLLHNGSKSLCRPPPVDLSALRRMISYLW